MALAEVQTPSSNIPKDVTKLTRRGSGEISIVSKARTILISYQVKSSMIRSFLPSTAPRGQISKPRKLETEVSLIVKVRSFTTF